MHKNRKLDLNVADNPAEICNNYHFDKFCMSKCFDLVNLFSHHCHSDFMRQNEKIC